MRVWEVLRKSELCARVCPSSPGTGSQGRNVNISLPNTPKLLLPADSYLCEQVCRSDELLAAPFIPTPRCADMRQLHIRRGKVHVFAQRATRPEFLLAKTGVMKAASSCCEAVF